MTRSRTRRFKPGQKSYGEVPNGSGVEEVEIDESVAIFPGQSLDAEAGLSAHARLKTSAAVSASSTRRPSRWISRKKLLVSNLKELAKEWRPLQLSIFFIIAFMLRCLGSGFDDHCHFALSVEIERDKWDPDVALQMLRLYHDFADAFAKEFDQMLFRIAIGWLLWMIFTLIDVSIEVSSHVSVDDVTACWLKARGISYHFKEFASRLQYIRFIGLGTYRPPDVRCVIHPVDRFLRRLYDKFAPKECADAFGVYKRTNPTFELKLAQLKKFDTPQAVSDHVASVFSLLVSNFINETVTSKHFNGFANAFTKIVQEEGFWSVDYVHTSSAGHPFPVGTKRKQVHVEACRRADHLYYDLDALRAFIEDHRWYTAGRAKLQALEKADAARLILYQSFILTLIAGKYHQTLMNYIILPSWDWCSIGDSWTSNGADKFAKHLDARCGVAPKGFKFRSIDISGWDVSLQSFLLRAAKSIHIAIMRAASNATGVCLAHYIEAFSMIMDDMIEAKVLLPGGYVIQLFGGMKSGWGATCADNSLIHELIYRYICMVGEQSILPHKITGDDNISLVEEDADDEKCRAAYLSLGLVTRMLHSSRSLCELDYLSKFIRYNSVTGHYYPWRPEIESHARLLMPEEFDPSRRDVPDQRIAAERLIGHLLDNPFNSNVRHVTRTLLTHIKKEYHIDEIVVDEEVLRRWRFNSRDVARQCGIIPMIPPDEFIESLYGVKFRDELRTVSDATAVDYSRYDSLKTSNSLDRFTMAYSNAMVVMAKLNNLSKPTRERVRKYTRPYGDLSLTAGTAGGKVLEIIKECGFTDFKHVLDLGTHPGSAAYAINRAYGNDVGITCVSLQPDQDSSFCPKVPLRDNIMVIQADANTFDSSEYSYDLVFDDAYDIVDPLTAADMLKHIHEHIDQAIIRFRRHTKAKRYIMKLRGIDESIIGKLYECYREYGEFHIIKPLFSYPWNIEVYVIFIRSNVRTMRKHHFARSIYRFLNDLSMNMAVWTDALASNLELLENGQNMIRCPLQNDESFKNHILEVLGIQLATKRPLKLRTWFYKSRERLKHKVVKEDK